MNIHFIYCIFVFLLLVPAQLHAVPEPGSVTMETLILTSPDFKYGAPIPRRFTCESRDVSPALEWEHAPQKTASFALIADDPDASMGTWVHWVIYHIPPHVHRLEENIPPVEILDEDMKQGVNSLSQIGYHGPCPPSGMHRYYFRIYALDDPLDTLGPGATKEQLLSAMEEHILAQGELMGTYQCKADRD